MVRNVSWLKELADLLSTFPVGKTPSPELFAEIQRVVDEAIFSVLESGGDLPSFILNPERLEAMRERLGDRRIAELAAKPLPRSDLEALIPLAVQLCSAFDALSMTDLPTKS